MSMSFLMQVSVVTGGFAPRLLHVIAGLSAYVGQGCVMSLIRLALLTCSLAFGILSPSGVCLRSPESLATSRLQTHAAGFRVHRALVSC